MAITNQIKGRYRFDGPAQIRTVLDRAGKPLGVDGGGLSVDNKRALDLGSALRWVKQNLFEPTPANFIIDVEDITKALARIVSNPAKLGILLETPENQKLLKVPLEKYLLIDELKADARKALDLLFPPAAAPATPAIEIQAPAAVPTPIAPEQSLELAEARSTISQLKSELVQVKARVDLLVHAKDTAETEARLAKQELVRTIRERDTAHDELEAGKALSAGAVYTARKEEEDNEIKFRNNIAKLEADIEGHMLRINVLEGDAIAADQQIRAAEEREGQLTAQIARLETNLAKKNQMIIDAAAKVRENDALLKELSDKVKLIKQEHDHLVAENQRLVNENADLKLQDTEDAVRRIAELEGELAVATADLKSLAGQRAVLEAEQRPTTLRGIAPVTLDAARLYLDEQVSAIRAIGIQMNRQEEAASRTLIREQAILKGLAREKRVVTDEINQRQALIKAEYAANRAGIEAERDSEISKHQTVIFSNMSEAWSNLALEPMDMAKRLTEIYGDPITEDIMLRYQTDLLKAESELTSRIKLLETRKQGIIERADAIIAGQAKKIEAAQAALQALGDKLAEAGEIEPAIAALNQGVQDIASRIEALAREFKA